VWQQRPKWTQKRRPANSIITQVNMTTKHNVTYPDITCNDRFAPYPYLALKETRILTATGFFLITYDKINS
jgi:hypothetical protein